jgi:uncharacterized protein
MTPHLVRIRSREIDAHHIGLIGHSEGGLIGPMVATRSKAVAFVVMLAGPGLPGADIIVAQRDLIARAMGETDEAALARSRDDQRRLFDLIKREKDPATLENKARALIEASIAHASDAEKKEMGNHRRLDPGARQEVITLRSRYRYLRCQRANDNA